MFSKHFKYLLIVFIGCLVHSPASAQTRYAVDTTFRAYSSCNAKFCPFWYLKAKRPESSRQLAIAADAMIPKGARDTTQNGFINMQFVVDCKGMRSAYRLSQIDSHYNPVLFPSAMVNALYEFVTDLNGWKPAVYKQEALYYNAYLAFKIKNGHVAEVSP